MPQPLSVAASGRGPIDEAEAHAEGGAVAVGTQRMERLRRPGRVGFVLFHQNLARQALAMGQRGAARAALRALRASDFAGGDLEGHLLTLRDSRATDEAVMDALQAILALDPQPVAGDLE